MPDHICKKQIYLTTDFVRKEKSGFRWLQLSMNEDFWLSLRGFKVTLGTQITKQSIYEILEYKVVIKQLLIDSLLLGPDYKPPVITTGGLQF